MTDYVPATAPAVLPSISAALTTQGYLMVYGLDRNGKAVPIQVDAEGRLIMHPGASVKIPRSPIRHPRPK